MLLESPHLCFFPRDSRTGSNSRGKRVISVRATEDLYYVFGLGQISLSMYIIFLSNECSLSFQSVAEQFAYKNFLSAK